MQSLNARGTLLIGRGGPRIPQVCTRHVMRGGHTRGNKRPFPLSISLLVQCQATEQHGASRSDRGSFSSTPPSLGMNCNSRATENTPLATTSLCTKLESCGNRGRDVSCSAAAGVGLGSSGRDDAATPLLGGDGGGYGGGAGDGAGGNGAGKGWDAGGEGAADDGDELLSLQAADKLAAAKGVQLPNDFVEAALTGGLRKSALEAYLLLQGSLVGGLLSRMFPIVRDRLINDPRYLFKVFAEVSIDAFCATLAEVRKRGDDFWAEFEFYLSDLVVGCVMDVVLVTLMAPAAVIGRQPKSAKATGLQKWLATIPSAVLEASTPGVRVYNVGQRAACILVKFGEYSLAGMACGFVGQGVANSLMLLKRRYVGAKEHDVEPPPVVMTALTWGLFMGVSSNLRYQVVFGLERLVDSTIGKKFPPVAYAGTFTFRFINNVLGGENFIDMARWTGIQ